MIAALALIFCSTALAWDEVPRPQPPGDISTGKYLYTKPDPAAGGGIKGKISNPQDYVVGVFALCPSQPRWCYAATRSGEKKREFEFTGLPMEKYDLVILYKNAVYEGLNLCREESTLTPKDREAIKGKVDVSEPFFDQKIIFRLEGKTGKGEMAAGIAAFIRNNSSTDNAVGSLFTDHRRSVKVFYMKQVLEPKKGWDPKKDNPWQMAIDREIYVNFLAPGTGPDIKGFYRPYLGGIRITDTVKDLGDIDLSKAAPARPAVRLATPRREE